MHQSCNSGSTPFSGVMRHHCLLRPYVIQYLRDADGVSSLLRLIKQGEITVIRWSYQVQYTNKYCNSVQCTNKPVAIADRSVAAIEIGGS